MASLVFASVAVDIDGIPVAAAAAADEVLVVAAADEEVVVLTMLVAARGVYHIGYLAHAGYR